MPKEIDDFTLCGETWYSITQAQDTIEHLQAIQRWLEAGETVDQDIRRTVIQARGLAIRLKQQLIDLEIKLLTSF